MRKIALLLSPAIVPVLLVVLWWNLAAHATSIYFPAPERIWGSFQDLWLFERWSSDVLPSLRRMGIGLLVAAVLGIGLGTLIGLVPIAYRAVNPYLEFLRAIPPAALIPAAILAVGIGDQMKIVIVVFGAVWPILLNTVEGVRGVHSTLRATMQTFGVGRARYVLRVVIPAAGPSISAGIRSALSLGIILIVVSEMVASTNGLGYFILISQRSFAIPDMWSGIILLGLLGVVLNCCYVLLERLVLRWYWQSQRMER
ncbi:ABC transporter permease [Nocardioides sp. L-11A]|uniref:ABC transporter permease n=1 Tax=Nocardioides sp. L-11A TaxID=3043848 RepID=UPI002499D498|nr:ABC transporter permease [Nocardioides sp. L-11A]